MNKKIICRIVWALFVVSIVPITACMKANTTVASSETTCTQIVETSNSPVTPSQISSTTSGTPQGNTTTPAPLTSSPLPTGSATLHPTVITITPPQPTTSPPATTSITTPSLTTLPPTINVTVDKTGFNPGTITVPAGTVVLWFSGEQRVPGCCTNCHVENGEIVPGKVPDHWVKSDSGTIINGWLSSNGIYACYFGTAGVYNYHDNLNPSLIGTIIVE